MLTLMLVGFVLVLTRCINNQLPEGKDPRGNVYAGSEACRQCHQEVYDNFIQAAHAKATSMPSAANIHGDFSNARDTFSFNSTAKVVMEKRIDGYYHVIYQGGKENGAYKVDLLFGSRKAQTSAYWANDRFYELPVSWYASVNGWGTSPGFPTDFIKIGRVVNQNCLDCHSSHIDIKPGASVFEEQLLNHSSLVYGIDCERCHGPALNHVNYHLTHPGLTTAYYLIKAKDLTHQQKLDACAICHSGNDKKKIQSRFFFKMGDTLSYFFMPRTSDAAIDVHGNQSTLMEQSKCFRDSKVMTCNTCHDPHKNAGNDLAVYSQQCMSCHQPQSAHFCPKFADMGESIKTNCIDCHMPKQASRAITFNLPGAKEESSYILRTHKIGIYGNADTVPKVR
ncbi:MAG: hypothetical protein JST81_00300 [Bacteroidetes bacterium]|nr:hypothetical protein [Bacteroidota bacterium]